MYKHGRSWWAKIKGRYYNLGDHKATAKEVERELRRNLGAKGGEVLKTDFVLVADFLDHFYENHCVVNYRESTLEGTPYVIRKLKQSVGDLFLCDLTEQRVRYAIIARQKEGVSNDTVHTEFGLLKTALNWGVKIRLLESNPMLKVPLPRKKQRVRFLSTDEEARFLEVLERPRFRRWKAIILLARETGLRLSSLRFLEWDRVDLFRRGLWVARTKNGDPNWMPLTERAHGLLLDRYRERDESNPLVFPGPNGPWARNYLSQVSRKICASAGVEKFRFHDYRHDFGTRVTEHGGDLGATQVLLGHKDIKSTLRYAHRLDERQRRALEKMESGERAQKAATEKKSEASNE